MAPEVLAKGVAYDSSADWFSFGCMLYKLLRGSVLDPLFLSLIGLTLQACVHIVQLVFFMQFCSRNVVYQLITCIRR